MSAADTAAIEEQKSPVFVPASLVAPAPASLVDEVEGLSLTSGSADQPSSSPAAAPSSVSSSSPLPLSSSSPSSLPPPLSPEQWLEEDRISTHKDDYVEVSVWTSKQNSTAVLYPKSRLANMGTDCMPNHSVFRTVEASTPEARLTFWQREGGEHMARFNNAEQHQCHLIFFMWHDFQQLEPAKQSTCKEDFTKRTYECLSKAGNATRVIRRLQAFAHFVCDGGDTYIEPSKFIDCNNEVVSNRQLFKKMVQKVLEDVKQSEQKHEAAVQRTTSSPPSRRVLDNTSGSKQRLPQLVVVTAAMCEKYANQVVAEHPLISSVRSAEVVDGLPIYTVKVKHGASSGDQDNLYSYDALVIREENQSVLAAYNAKWKKTVDKIGDQIDPTTKLRTSTVTWKGKPLAVEVSARFFGLVGWTDYYGLIQLSPLDDDDEGKRALFTPVRSAALRPRLSSATVSASSLSSTSSTPGTPADKTMQQLHELVERVASKGMSAARLHALCARIEEELRESSTPAAETERDTGSEMDEENEKGDGSAAEDDEKDGSAQCDGDDEQEEDGEEVHIVRMDEDEVPSKAESSRPRSTRSSKRHAQETLSSGTKKRA